MGKAKGIDIEKTIREILEQASEDRKIARELLDDLKKGITSPDDHVVKGAIAKEYMKAMTKSTDQMIKLVETALRHSDEEEDHTISSIREMVENMGSNNATGDDQSSDGEGDDD